VKLAEYVHGTRGHSHSENAETPGVTLEHGRSYDALVDVFFAGRRSAVFNRLVQLSGAKPGDRVLDVGCGTGYLTRRLARAATPKGKAIGLDASSGMLQQARRACPSDTCEFVVGAAEKLEFNDGSFDVVTSSLMLHHLPAQLRAEALSEMHRVLRPGGRLLIAEFRPPTTRLARHLIGSMTGPAMQENMRAALPDLIRTAGFPPPKTGDLRPWITYALTERQ
jgi:ubiquinone/menaquinone biosynthesis C-methylase UbiE